MTEQSPNKTSTPIRIESKNQFAPQGADPKELKNQQKQVPNPTRNPLLTLLYEEKSNLY